MKNILITGAGGGLGTGIVDFLLKNRNKDENIFCQYRTNDEKLRDIFKKHNLSFEDHCFNAELTNETSIWLLHKELKERCKSLWGLVNLAGGSSNGMSWKLSRDEFVKIIDTNLISTFLMCKEFIPELREQKAGRIINVSSVVAFTGVPGASHYCAAKAGIVGLTKSLALELANCSVTANVLALGYFDQGLINHIPEKLQEDLKAKTPLKRFGKASEIGGLLKFILSDESEFTTGHVYHMNGGFYV